jgi:hypothetical protein
MALNAKKMDWAKFIGRTVNITMNENYGIVYGSKNEDQPTFYEIVFKTGKLAETFDDALLLDAATESQIYKIYIPLSSIKCVEIF